LFSDRQEGRGSVLSLRLRLIGLVAMVFVLSLAFGGTVACLNASRSVQAEMRAALAAARQTIATAAAALGRSDAPRRDLDQLIASFRGNRHLRVALDGETGADPPPPAEVPGWFVRLIGVPPDVLRMPVVAGRDYGTIVIETAPRNIAIALDSGEQEDDDALVVMVSDDGQGMSAEPGIGYGLLAMSERVKALGGSLAVSSGVGAGLVATALLPQNPHRRTLTSAAAAA
jgi:hypothetical protein